MTNSPDRLRRSVAVAALCVAAAGGLLAWSGVATSSQTAPPVRHGIIAFINSIEGVQVLRPASALTKPTVSGRDAIGTIVAREPAGTLILGETLAWEGQPWAGPNVSRQLVWLISINPAGGVRPATAAVKNKPYNFQIDIIDATTGRYLGDEEGASSSLPPLPSIPNHA